MRVAICVCTCKRPQLLTACLEALANQVVPDGIDKSLVVVDNEESPNNKEIVTKFGAHYVHEPRRGISYARNRALQEAVSISSDWVAFVDDDQEPLRDWLSSLIQAQAEHNADVVQSRLIFDSLSVPHSGHPRMDVTPLTKEPGGESKKERRLAALCFEPVTRRNSGLTTILRSSAVKMATSSAAYTQQARKLFTLSALAS
jgi:glycosyltransferase involved in cell wall biosynthesis